MGISLYKMKKWYQMLTDTSIYHVIQGVGTCYSKTEVTGYYNDLTEKVMKDDPAILVPKYSVDAGEKIYFSIGVFQYGLAAYDLFLTTHNEIYKEKMIACANWAVENQQEDGSWVTFAYKNPLYPYSSMAQGEGISLLIRAHIATNEARYWEAAAKAKTFMLKPISRGGTAEHSDEDLLLYEYTGSSVILNGWIFSLWGLYDYCKYCEDTQAKAELSKTLETLSRKLADFDAGFWSKYDAERRIASPFYHSLHIAQLNAMYDLFGDPIYKEFAEKWERQSNHFWKSKLAFLVKAWQKIVE